MRSKTIFMIFAAIITAFSVIVVNSCISEFDARLPADENDVLVVTGDIIGNSEVDIVLSKTFPIGNPAPPPESQNITATVTVVGSDGSTTASGIQVDKGTYRLSIGELDGDVSYGLRIEYNGNVYISEPARPLHTPDIKELSWEQPEPYGDVYFRVSTGEAPSDEPQYFIWSYREDWKFLAYEYTELYYDYDLKKISMLSEPEILEKYICWKSNVKNKLLIGTTQGLIVNSLVNKRILEVQSGSDRFSTDYCLTVSQKSVSKAAYEYYRNKKTENEEMGGIFTPQPSEVLGNITCVTDHAKKTIGFVSVLKNVSVKRLFVSGGELVRINPGCEFFIEPEIFEENRAKQGLEEWEYASRNDLEPVGTEWENGTDPLIPYKLIGWARTICVDCVIAGGTKNKPDFWPEEAD